MDPNQAPEPDSLSTRARFVEELSLNAWPALQTIAYDGWLLRFADGYTRRANSVSPLYFPSSSTDLADRIEHCQSAYFWKGQDTVFKMSPASTPADLDDALARRGYALDAPTSVQTLSLDDEASLPDSESAWGSAEPTEAWVASFCRLSGIAPSRGELLVRMLGCIVPARRFAAIYEGDEPVAMGLAVVERGYVGLWDIVTAAPHRNRGLGRQMIGHLLRWGKASGATVAYLSVMYENAPALHLYAALGFREEYSYWYRILRRG